MARKRNQRKHRKWSKAVRDRDNNRCQHCGDTTKLHAHHIIALKDCINFPLEFEVSNGITLCPKCHGQEHKRINALDRH